MFKRSKVFVKAAREYVRDAVFISGQTLTIHDCSNYRTNDSGHLVSRSDDHDNPNRRDHEEDVALAP